MSAREGPRALGPARWQRGDSRVGLRLPVAGSRRLTGVSVTIRSSRPSCDPGGLGHLQRQEAATLAFKTSPSWAVLCRKWVADGERWRAEGGGSQACPRQWLEALGPPVIRGVRPLVAPTAGLITEDKRWRATEASAPGVGGSRCGSGPCTRTFAGLKGEGAQARGCLGSPSTGTRPATPYRARTWHKGTLSGHRSRWAPRPASQTGTHGARGRLPPPPASFFP